MQKLPKLIIESVTNPNWKNYKIKAIETEYKGFRFRSRLEARWAVYFDSIGIEWEYENEGYQFPDETRYLPDFWFPQVKMFAEVKGKDLNLERRVINDNKI